LIELERLDDRCDDFHLPIPCYCMLAVARRLESGLTTRLTQPWFEGAIAPTAETLQKPCQRSGVLENLQDLAAIKRPLRLSP
ncbi:MAG: hypothetical protein EBS82_04005, partial [Methylocystaceae bacterium]|nr:hypothetical protein [Methylocystaceae bacterium]